VGGADFTTNRHQRNLKISAGTKQDLRRRLEASRKQGQQGEEKRKRVGAKGENEKNMKKSAGTIGQMTRKKKTTSVSKRERKKGKVGSAIRFRVSTTSQGGKSKKKETEHTHEFRGEEKGQNRKKPTVDWELHQYMEKHKLETIF